MLTNIFVLPYDGEDFERVLVIVYSGKGPVMCDC
jgi:hypothetical protein